jgi:hypothetical protein
MTSNYWEQTAQRHADQAIDLSAFWLPGSSPAYVLDTTSLMYCRGSEHKQRLTEVLMWVVVGLIVLPCLKEQTSGGSEQKTEVLMYCICTEIAHVSFSHMFTPIPCRPYLPSLHGYV